MVLFDVEHAIEEASDGHHHHQRPSSKLILIEPKHESADRLVLDVILMTVYVLCGMARNQPWLEALFAQSSFDDC